jgi:pimeloyl-ACP methyl ester carboxylesterase
MSERWVEDSESYRLVHGAYFSPIFQTGELPYSASGGELIVEDGVPQVTGQYEARYAITVPTGEMPAGGWPLVLYAHGTGGDYQTFVRNRVADDLAREGYAVMGVDQIHHGPRNPTPSGPESLVFNFGNPLAFRDNARQAALDVVAQAAFIRAHPEVGARVIGAGTVIDPEQVYFYGHSQGGLNGPLFLAVDDQAKGGVLSGAGGHLAIALVDKVEPVNIPQLVAFLLRVPGSGERALEEEHLVYEHPILALLQTWTDVADPTNYAHLLFRRPRPGFAPKSILQTEGITDLYTPPRSIEALATAARIPPLMPVLQPIEPMDVVGVEPVAGPVTANVAGGMATAGLIQADGGHFVAFDDDLRSRIAAFFASFDEGLPTIP